MISSREPSRLSSIPLRLTLFAALAVAAAASCSTVTERQPEQATTAAVLPTSEELIDEAKEVMGRVVYARNRGFAKEPQIELVGRARLEKILVEDFDKDMPPRRLDAMQKSLIKLGLLPKGYDLKRSLMAIMTEQVGGGYDPRSKKLYLINRWSLPVQRFVLSHELTHVMQDQHHDILSLPLNHPHNDDLALAIRSLLEGEAMLVSTKYLNTLSLGQRASMLLRVAAEGYAGSGSLTGMTASLTEAPAYLRDSLLFPYFEGTLFVTSVQALDGWKGVSRLYDDVPLSTEQIMHPFKYIFDRDVPVQVDLPDLGAVLKGWSRLTDNVAGEFGIYVLLKARAAGGRDASLVERFQQARAAAGGWGGDHYQTYRHEKDGRVAIVWFTTWDTARDAKEFAEAYRRAVAGRYPDAAPGGEAEKKPTGGAPFRHRWTVGPAHEVVVTLRSKAKDVLIIDGLDPPAAELAEAAVWKGAKKSPFIWKRNREAPSRAAKQDTPRQ